MWGLTEDWNSITATWIAVFYLRNAYIARMLYGKDPIWVSGSFFNKETRWEFHRQTEALFLEFHRKSTCLENSLLDLTGKSEASSMPRGRWPTTQSYHSHSGISLVFTQCLIKDGVWCNDRTLKEFASGSIWTFPDSAQLGRKTPATQQHAGLVLLRNRGLRDRV